MTFGSAIIIDTPEGGTGGGGGGGGGGGDCGITDTFNRPDSPTPGITDSGVTWIVSGPYETGALMGIAGGRLHMRNADFGADPDYPGYYQAAPAALLPNGLLAEAGTVLWTPVNVGGTPMMHISLGHSSSIDFLHDPAHGIANLVRVFRPAAYADGTFALTPGVTYHIKWIDTAAVTSVKLWAVGTPEPAAWLITNATPSATTSAFALVHHLNAQVQFESYFDDLDLDGIDRCTVGAGDCGITDTFADRTTTADWGSASMGGANALYALPGPTGTGASLLATVSGGVGRLGFAAGATVSGQFRSRIYSNSRFPLPFDQTFDFNAGTANYPVVRLYVGGSPTGDHVLGLSFFGNPSWSSGAVQVQGWNDSGVATTGIDWTTTKRVRFRVEATTAGHAIGMFKVWDPASAEPTSWDAHTYDDEVIGDTSFMQWELIQAISPPAPMPLAYFEVTNLDVVGVNQCTGGGPVETFSRIGVLGWGTSEFVGTPPWLYDPSSPDGSHFYTDGSRGYIDAVALPGYGDDVIAAIVGPFSLPIEITGIMAPFVSQATPSWDNSFILCRDGTAFHGEPVGWEWLENPGNPVFNGPTLGVNDARINGGAGHDVTNYVAGNCASGGIPASPLVNNVDINWRMRVDETGTHVRMWIGSTEPTGWHAERISNIGPLAAPDADSVFCEAIQFQNFYFPGSPGTTLVGWDNIAFVFGRPHETGSGGSTDPGSSGTEDVEFYGPIATGWGG